MGQCQGPNYRPAHRWRLFDLRGLGIPTPWPPGATPLPDEASALLGFASAVQCLCNAVPHNAITVRCLSSPVLKRCSAATPHCHGYSAPCPSTTPHCHSCADPILRQSIPMPCRSCAYRRRTCAKPIQSFALALPSRTLRRYAMPMHSHSSARPRVPTPVLCLSIPMRCLDIPPLTPLSRSYAFP